MPEDSSTLLLRLVGGDAAAAAAVLDQAPTATDPALLVAAALLTNSPNDMLARAERLAVTTRDRQLVAIAAAHLDRDGSLLDALVRDHLSDHPDNVLAAWIAAMHR
jgi:hypothetical protein